MNKTVITEEYLKSLNLEEIKNSAKPCPFCGSLDLEFTCETHHGHGDCGFQNARIKCKNCSGSKGDGHNYGTPTDVDKIFAYLQWNNRI